MACRKRVAGIFRWYFSMHSQLTHMHAGELLQLFFDARPIYVRVRCNGILFPKKISVKGKSTSVKNEIHLRVSRVERKCDERNSVHQNLIKPEPFHYTAWINRRIHGWCHYFDLFSGWAQCECRFFRNMCETSYYMQCNMHLRYFADGIGIALHTHSTHIPNICHTTFDCGIALSKYLTWNSF